MRWLYTIILTLTWISHDMYGQSAPHKVYIYSQTDLKDSLTTNDTISIEKKIQHYLIHLQAEGYMEASIDSIIQNDTLVNLYVHKGPIYQWANILMDSLPSMVRPAIPSFTNFKHNVINLSQYEQFSKTLLRYADEIGYPFASISLKNIHISNDKKVSAIMHMDLGLAPTIDSIQLHTELNISKRFLLQYLDIEEGMAYNPKRLSKITNRLQSLPYLEIEKDWELELGHMSKTLHIYLKEKKANQINAIVGLQPSNIENKNYDITADVLLALHNPFGYGEHFKLSYQQLQAQSPKFHSSAMWPYLLGTAFGVTGSFDLLQQDTTFRRTIGHIGIIYQLNPQDHIKVYYERQSNRAIVFDTNYTKVNKRLPPNIDIITAGIGMGMEVSRLNNTLNPSKGYIINATALTAQRQVIQNNAIDEISDAATFNYRQLYDTLNVNKLQARVQSSIHVYIPMVKATTLKLAYELGWISGKQLFRNELYQIGGFKKLRGFNEWSIHSPHYHQVTIEPRLLMNRMSHLFAFTDIAYVEQMNLLNERKFDWAYSIGIGGALDSNRGLFNVALAVGKIGNEPLQFRNLRIHFGYAIYF